MLELGEGAKEKRMGTSKEKGSSEKMKRKKQPEAHSQHELLKMLGYEETNDKGNELETLKNKVVKGTRKISILSN
jgi:hypothetical protein